MLVLTVVSLCVVFETALISGRIWYDISVIPVDCGASWDKCTGTKKGFNVAMSVVPQNNPSGSCKALYCGSATCSDAYLFPNDIKTHDCSANEPMLITFC